MPTFHSRCGATSRGMSLVELMLVMAILSVVMMAVISLYIPTHQSTVAQTQVTDVQSNLRLALDRMTQDLLTAGFLTPGAAISSNSANSLTIHTRLVSQGFARVGANAAAGGGGSIQLTLSNPAMTAMFQKRTATSPGSFVRLVEGVSATEINEATVADPSERVYEVTDKTANTIDIEDPAGNLQPANVRKETVVVRLKDATQPPVHTILYRVNNGALERIVNGETQFLARNITAINFGYSLTPQGKVHKVEISLTGQTRALKNDAVSGTKTRTLQTSVTLRNVS